MKEINIKITAWQNGMSFCAETVISKDNGQVRIETATEGNSEQDAIKNALMCIGYHYIDLTDGE